MFSILCFISHCEYDCLLDLRGKRVIIRSVVFDYWKYLLILGMSSPGLLIGSGLFFFFFNDFPSHPLIFLVCDLTK